MQEHVHEDLKVMKKELDQWRDEYSKRNDVRIAAACESFVAGGGVHEYAFPVRCRSHQAMATQLKETEDSLRPLQSELKTVEAQIAESYARINATKVRVCAFLRHTGRRGSCCRA